MMFWRRRLHGSRPASDPFDLYAGTGMRSIIRAPRRPPAGMARFRAGPAQGIGRVEEVPEYLQPSVPPFDAWLDQGWVPAGYAWWAPQSPTPAASWEIASRLLKPGEDSFAFALDVVYRLRELEASNCDWPRGEVERLHQEFEGSVLSGTIVDCRQALRSSGEIRWALRSVELPEEVTLVREILEPEEYALFRLAQLRILSLDMRHGVDPAAGRWDPYRPSEVLAALLQMIECIITETADGLLGKLADE